MDISELLNKLAIHLTEILPDAPGVLKADLQKNFRAILEAGFAKLDLVTREEFDVQTKVLARCRQKITELEEILKSIEPGK